METMLLTDFLKSMKIDMEMVTVTVPFLALDMFNGEFIGQCTPLFRWLDGKSQLLSAIRFYTPQRYNTYYEPFVGGGSLLFSLMPKKAVINDNNKVITNLYEDVKDNYGELVRLLNLLLKLPETDSVLLTLKNIYQSNIETENYTTELSALFLYLNNKTVANFYNINQKDETIISDFGLETNIEKFKYAHDYFNHNEIKIKTGDFTEALIDAVHGDFVYLDPPNDFEEKDLLRLSKEFKRLSELGVKCMLSVSDSKAIRKMYKGFTIKELNVNFYTQKEKKKRECLILNY